MNVSVTDFIFRIYDADHLDFHCARHYKGNVSVCTYTAISHYSYGGFTLISLASVKSVESRQIQD